MITKSEKLQYIDWVQENNQYETISRVCLVYLHFVKWKSWEGALSLPRFDFFFKSWEDDVLGFLAVYVHILYGFWKDVNWFACL